MERLSFSSLTVSCSLVLPVSFPSNLNFDIVFIKIWSAAFIVLSLFSIILTSLVEQGCGQGRSGILVIIENVETLLNWSFIVFLISILSHFLIVFHRLPSFRSQLGGKRSGEAGHQSFCKSSYISFFA